MRNVPQYLLSGFRYCKEEILEVYFYIIRHCFACFEIFFCLHTLPWQPFFQLVTGSRNDKSHLESMILTRLHSNLMGRWDLRL